MPSKRKMDNLYTVQPVATSEPKKPRNRVPRKKKTAAPSSEDQIVDLNDIIATEPKPKRKPNNKPKPAPLEEKEESKSDSIKEEEEGAEIKQEEESKTPRKKRSVHTTEAQTVRRKEDLVNLERDLGIHLEYNSETGSVKCGQCNKGVNYNSLMKHLFGTGAIKKTMEHFRTHLESLSPATTNEQKCEYYVKYMKNIGKGCKHLNVLLGTEVASPSYSPLSPTSDLSVSPMITPAKSKRRTLISVDESRPVIYHNGIAILLIDDNLVIVTRNVGSSTSFKEQTPADTMRKQLTEDGMIRIRHRLSDIPSHDIFDALKKSGVMTSITADEQENLFEGLHCEISRGFIIKPPKPIDTMKPAIRTTTVDNQWTVSIYPMKQ